MDRQLTSEWMCVCDEDQLDKMIFCGCVAEKSKINKQTRTKNRDSLQCERCHPLGFSPAGLFSFSRLLAGLSSASYAKVSIVLSFWFPPGLNSSVPCLPADYSHQFERFGFRLLPFFLPLSVLLLSMCVAPNHNKIVCSSSLATPQKVFPLFLTGLVWEHIWRKQTQTWCKFAFHWQSTSGRVSPRKGNCTKLFVLSFFVVENCKRRTKVISNVCKNNFLPKRGRLHSMCVWHTKHVLPKSL